MKVFLKILGVVAALVAIRWVIGTTDLKAEFRTADPSGMTIAFFLYGVGVALSSYRWTRLLEVQGVVFSTIQAIRLTMIGVFFNVVVPGGVGGDAIKMYYVRQAAAGDKTPEALLTVLVDRIIGLLGLFVVAILAVIVNWDFLMQASEGIRLTVVSVFSIAVIGFACVALAMFNDYLLKIPPLRLILEAIAHRGPHKIVALVKRIVKALVLYRQHFPNVMVCLLISVVIHSLTALTLYCIGLSVHAAVLQLKDYFLATQIANTISAVPITPGGLGGRDAILKLFFTAAGEGQKSAVIPIMNSMLMVLWSLIGGVVFFLEGRDRGVQNTNA